MKLATYLDINNLTQKEFADMVGITETSIANYIHRRRVPATHIAGKIEKVTKGKVTLHDFLEGEE